MPIPVNIITGVLGVGKTTAIRHLLSQRPPHERWAIVVNEFGALGIDGAVLDTAGGLVTAGDAAGDGGVTVREVAGGCLCCAVSAPFTVAVTQVLRRAKPDRLFIEPSGMGHPGGLFDVLSGEHLGKTLELRATIALVDMTEVHCADVVVGARADVASTSDVEAFQRWAVDELYPAKSHVTTIAHGALPLDILDIACGPTAPAPLLSVHRVAAATAAMAAGGGGGMGPLGSVPIPMVVVPGRPQRVLGGTSEFKTAGWVFSREDVFARPRLTALFEALASEPRVKRFKGVMRVGAEWVMPIVQVEAGRANGVRIKLEPIAYRRDSRLEVIVMVSSSAGNEEGACNEGDGGGEEVEGTECAARAAAACDWDALEAAIKAAIRPPKAVKN